MYGPPLSTSLALIKRSEGGLGILLKLASGLHNRLIYSKVEPPPPPPFLSPCRASSYCSSVIIAPSPSCFSSSFNSCFFDVQLFTSSQTNPCHYQFISQEMNIFPAHCYCYHSNIKLEFTLQC